MAHAFAAFNRPHRWTLWYLAFGCSVALLRCDEIRLCRCLGHRRLYRVVETVARFPVLLESRSADSRGHVLLRCVPRRSCSQRTETRLSKLVVEGRKYA